MGTLALIVVGVFALLIVFPYVLLPIVVHQTLKFRVPAEVMRVDPQQANLPADVRHFMAQHYEQLTSLGFEMGDVLYFPVIVANPRTLVACYVHRASGDGAISAFVLGESELTSLRKHHVEFMRGTADGKIVQTNNSDDLSSFPSREGEYTTQFFGLQDLRQLHAYHLYTANKYLGTTPGRLRVLTEFQGNYPAYFSQVVFGEVLRRQFTTGYLRDCGAEIRPTLKGAFLMAWKELFPWKTIRKAARRKAAEAIKRECPS